MHPQVLNGKKVAEEQKSLIKAKAQELEERLGRPPGLAAVLVGHNGASETYVAAKMKACAECGMHSFTVRLPADIAEEDLLQEIEHLNQRADVDGFIVQLPLPSHISVQRVTEAIRPSKDVDCFHPENVGLLALGRPRFLPATPGGILTLLRYYGIPVEGRHVVVVGRSHIVGLPLSLLLAAPSPEGNATVTLCHSRTQHLQEHTRRADILVAALGRPAFIKAHHVKPGVVVVDVGITRVPDPQSPNGYRLVGDVDHTEVAPLCSAITPVPGGVGPMTIVTLLWNTIRAAGGND
ncbi:MAG: bifunctional 5,10-methylenetetrahydrofolate dehydrogenase/5,10-methenyltetrahydrofolate cyclohydrolase [Flavobacteriales bacterium]|nr:bifunctional 5,10-methylenetetrahydrofolate dehydrogenase/5,10-methenyltetrahydrofolate cyclohydrolase [Flavobacteriales bacterium]